jgi:hypothetical protein
VSCGARQFAPLCPQEIAWIGFQSFLTVAQFVAHAEIAKLVQVWHKPCKKLQ